MSSRAVNPILAGLVGRCPNCGEGPLFSGFLKVSPGCEACGFDLKSADSGDGPAFFVILLGGFAVCFGALFCDLTFHLSPWLEVLIFLPLSLGICLSMLRPAKGLMIAMQFANKASEAGRGSILPPGDA